MVVWDHHFFEFLVSGKGIMGRGPPPYAGTPRKKTIMKLMGFSVKADLGAAAHGSSA